MHNMHQSEDDSDGNNRASTLSQSSAFDFSGASCVFLHSLTFPQLFRIVRSSNSHVETCSHVVCVRQVLRPQSSKVPWFLSSARESRKTETSLVYNSRERTTKGSLLCHSCLCTLILPSCAKYLQGEASCGGAVYGKLDEMSPAPCP